MLGEVMNINIYSSLKLSIGLQVSATQSTTTITIYS